MSYYATTGQANALQPKAEDQRFTAVVECHRCGRQWTAPCNFDEDYS